MTAAETPQVLLLSDLKRSDVEDLLQRFGLQLQLVAANAEIPGSFWGDSEAGLIQHLLYARTDTPVHSILHEACHYICMDERRRKALHTNAGGDTDEENAVCYLQILLAKELAEVGSQRLMQDMDSWGYSFRLGSAQRWFEEDAEEARSWLILHQLIEARSSQVTFSCRR